MASPTDLSQNGPVQDQQNTISPLISESPMDAVVTIEDSNANLNGAVKEGCTPSKNILDISYPNTGKAYKKKKRKNRLKNTVQSTDEDCTDLESDTPTDNLIDKEELDLNFINDIAIPFENMLIETLELLRNSANFKNLGHKVAQTLNKINDHHNQFKNKYLELKSKISNENTLFSVLSETTTEKIDTFAQDNKNQFPSIPFFDQNDSRDNNMDINFPDTLNQNCRGNNISFSKTKRFKTTPPSPTRINHTINDPNPEDDFTLQKKISKIPPIVIKDNNFNWKDFNKQLQDKDIKDYNARNNGDYFTIKTKKTEDRCRIITILKEANIAHHTYSLPEERTFRVVVKKVPKEYSAEDVQYELAKVNSSVINVTQMYRRNHGNKIPMPTFVATLNKEIPSCKDIYNIKYLFNMCINIEEYRKSDRPSQCHRCQDFFHGQRLCNHPHRCVKCAGNHATNECTKTNDEPPKCCNCGGDHPANYSKCPKYESIVEKMYNRTNNRRSFSNRENRNNFNSNTTSSRFSYANVVQNNSTQQPINLNPALLLQQAVEASNNLAKCISIFQQQLLNNSFSSQRMIPTMGLAGGAFQALNAKPKKLSSTKTIEPPPERDSQTSTTTDDQTKEKEPAAEAEI
nr:uncharacterized protein LOC122271377 [Parasteatoda tepidariorum]